MAVEDEFGEMQSDRFHPAGNGIILNSISPLQMKDQFPCVNDCSPKVRKPYTITKQRERWTEEEHRKFIEALKLHGRAWRRIEEHVGTKTAVQIRSHAQKFFSKVVRESGGSNTSSVQPIEIPPPRPKRKPTHPYPRKMIHPLNKDTATSEQPLRSLSPNWSISEQESQSPTSVLSAVCSTDSDTTNCSLSPVLRVGGDHPVDFRIAEENGSLSPVSISATNESKVPHKPSFAKECAHSVQKSLKLFGRTVLVTECDPSTGPSGLLPLDIKEDKIVQPIPWNFVRADLQSANSEHTWSPLAQEPHGVFYMQFMKENLSTVSTASSVSPPWWIPSRSIPFPYVPCHFQKSVEGSNGPNGEEAQDKEVQKEGSSTGSNSGLEDGCENMDKIVEGETLSSLPCETKEGRLVFELKSNEKPCSFDLRLSPSMSGKGFVPYKKRTAARDSPSQTMLASGERAEQRIRLSL